MSISTIRDGLKAALSAIAGLRTYDLTPDNVVTPAAIVMGPSIRYDDTMARGCDRHTYTVRLLVSRATDRAAQGNLDAYLTTTAAAIPFVDDAGAFLVTDTGATLVNSLAETGYSVKAALETDPTLAGVAYTLRVQRASGYGAYEVAGVQYLGVDFAVELLAAG